MHRDLSFPTGFDASPTPHHEISTPGGDSQPEFQVIRGPSTTTRDLEIQTTIVTVEVPPPYKNTH